MKKFSARIQISSEGNQHVDRKAGKILGLSAMKVGPAIGHDVEIDEVTLSQIEELGNLSNRGVKARFTHPGLCSNGLGKMLGHVSNFQIDGDKVLGDFTAIKAANKDYLDHILNLAEESPEDFGMSVVVHSYSAYKDLKGNEFTEVPEESVNDADGKPVEYLRVTKLKAVDFVDEPAANDDGLFSEGHDISDIFKGTSNKAAEQAFAVLDQLSKKYQLSAEDLLSFSNRYLSTRGVDLSLAPHSPTGSEPEEHQGMDIKTIRALSEAHPDSAAKIIELADAGKSEAEIKDLLRTDELASAKQANTELQTKVDSLTTELAESGKKVQELEKQLSELEPHGDTIDPGADVAPVGGEQDPLKITQEEFDSLEGMELAQFIDAGGKVEGK